MNNVGSGWWRLIHINHHPPICGCGWGDRGGYYHIFFYLYFCLLISYVLVVVISISFLGSLLFSGSLLGRMESINLAGVLQEAGDADSRG